MTLKSRRLKIGGLILLGIVAVSWIFYFYPDEHPYSLIKGQVDSEQVSRSSKSLLTELGFDRQEYDTKNRLLQDVDLINQLQETMGRKKMLQEYKELAGDQQRLPLFYWQTNISLYRDQDSEDNDQNGDSEEDDRENFENDDELHLAFTQNGQLFRYQNSEKSLPSRLIDQKVLRQIKLLPPQSKKQATPDSLLQKISFDLTRQGIQELKQDRLLEVLYSDLRQGIPIVLSAKMAEKMARFHLNKFLWSPRDFKLDTVEAISYKSKRAARVIFRKKEAVLDHQVILRADVLPTGRLLAMTPEFDLSENARSPETSSSQIWDIVRFGLSLVVSIFILFLFYRRLKIRVIDTKSSLVISLIGGVTLPTAAGIFMLGQFNFGTATSMWEMVLVLFAGIGVTGAIATLVFFVLASVSESITREAWPQKLEVYNLIRQGLFLTRPVGKALLNAVVYAAVLGVLWTLFMQLFPGIAIELSDGTSDSIFYTDSMPVPFLYVMAKMGWTTLGIVFVIYTTLGSVAYNYYEKTWGALLVMTAFAALLPFFPFELSPIYMEVVGGGIIGAGLAICFLYSDAITTILTLFLFLLLFQIETAWIPAYSVDHHMTYMLAVVVFLMVGTGTWAWTLGRKDKQLPEYIPEYVEELAREQRMKQELEIAKRVQQDFLPLETPAIKGWDIAAVCRPAYETGGDYYDVIQIDDHRYAVAIGDVSGKGIEAAFYMTFVKGVLHSLSHETNSPSMLMQKANRIFYENAPRGTFISLVYGILDLEKDTLTYARAGHNPILYKPKAEDVQLLKPSGIGLGMDHGSRFNSTIKEQELRFNPGDLLIMYTDGFVEAVNPGREFFGYKRFLRTFKQVADLNAQQILDETTRELDAFIADAQQHDDMTMIVLKKM